MMIPRFMTSPKGLVERLRKTSRYWQGYGNGSDRPCGSVWKYFLFDDLTETRLTEPVVSHVTSYTLDEYVGLGRDKRYEEAFRYIVVPGKPRITVAGAKEMKDSEVETIFKRVCDELVKSIGVSPSERRETDVRENYIRPPHIIYNYRKFDWDTGGFDIFTQFDIFVAPSEELVRKYSRISQSNIFGGMPPQLILDRGEKYTEILHRLG